MVLNDRGKNVCEGALRIAPGIEGKYVNPLLLKIKMLILNKNGKSETTEMIFRILGANAPWTSVK